jgi:uncharacterized protein YndB with AHSA1/START domain
MDLGSFIEFGGRPAVRFERTYTHTAERVWAAITDPGELAHWFPSSVELEPRAGGSISFSGDPHSSQQTGVVLAFDPPRRLSYTWGGDELHFELEPLADGQCRLILINVLADRSAAARNAAGWDVCLDQLARLVAGQSAGGPHTESATPWQPRYDAYVATGMPSGADIPTGR